MLDKLFTVALMLAALSSPRVARAQAGTVPEQVRVSVRSGQDTENDTKKREEVVLSVEVEDAAGNPAAGARVEFAAPPIGASGVFATGSKTVAIIADESGTAEVRGFRPNTIAGSFQITVRAAYQGAEGTAIIRQKNIGAATKSKRWIAILAGVGGGAASVAALCCGSDNSSSPEPVNVPASPNLSIAAISNTPTLARGSTASFTLTVSNSGAAATAGTVTVTDSVPTGLTPTAVSGTGWTCNISGQTATCTRSDALNARESFPSITVSVDVSANAPSSLTNTATVSGGGSGSTAASGSVTVGTGGGPDLTIAKTASSPTFSRGGTGTFTLTATNSGGTPTNGTPVTVTDSLPSELTPTAANGVGWTCNISGQIVTCTRTDVLNAGASYPAISLSVSVASNAAASVTNSASVSGGGDTTPATGSVTVNTVTGPDLNISKTASASTLARGATGSFTLAVTNNGGTATNGTVVTVTDSLPTGLTPSAASGTGWTCGSSGQTVTCTRSDVLNAGASYPAISVSVSVGSNVAASVTNSASVSGGGDTTPATGSATVNTQSGPNLNLAKTASASILRRGSTGSFTLTVTNDGDTATNGTITVSDPMPAGLKPTAAAATGWSCSVSGQVVTCTRSEALSAGASYPGISVSVEVAADAPPSLTNSATVSGGGDTTPGTGSVTINTVSGPNLAIAKAANASTLRRGEPGSFTLTVMNNGDTATNGTAVTVSDPFPAGLTPTAATGTGWTCSVSAQTVTCTRSDVLNPGASYPAISLSFNVATDASPSLTNTAAVSGGGDSTPGNGSATINTVAGPDLIISKTASAGTLGRGATGSFALAVINNGDTATNGTVTVMDSMPLGLTPTTASGAGWTCPISAQTVSCTRSDILNPGGSYPPVSVTVNVAFDAPASITNIASVSGGGDATAGTSSVTVGTVAGPDLTISKTASAPSLRRGATGSFTLTATNSGDTPTNGTVTVSDPVPTGLSPTAGTGTGWTCTIAGQTVTCTRSDVLQSGASYPPISLAVNVASDAPASIMNSASVSGGGDTTPGTGSVTVSTVAGPDLTISKTASAPSFRRGGTGSFTLTATNSGGTATNGTTVTVSDPVPAGLTPTAAAGTGWTRTIAGQTVTCTRTDVLNAGASYPAISLSVNVAANAPPSLMNSATINGGGVATPGTGSVTITTQAPNLTISKTASLATFTRGGTGTFTLTVKNEGDTATNGTVTVNDPVPSGLPPTAATGTGWTCTISAQTVNCTRMDALNAGDSYPPISIAVNVASNATGPLTNTAAVSGGGDDTPSNGSVTVATAILPNLTMTKTANNPAFIRGGTGTFMLTVKNTGTAATNNTVVTVADTLPDGLRPTSSSGNGWTCAIAVQLVTCTRTNMLGTNASYPVISIAVSVASSAPASITNTASVSGGGDDTPDEGSVTVTTVTSLAITKVADQPVVAPGDTVAFSLGIENPADIPLSDTTLNDTLPTGFTYTPGSAKLFVFSSTGESTPGREVTPIITSDGLRFSIGTLPPASRAAITYAVLVTSKARPGELRSLVAGFASFLSGERVNAIPGQVRLVVRPSAFTLTQVLIGRVFEDINQNGKFDNGEPGVPNVRVVNSSGQAVTTDAYGQYNLPSLAPGSIMVALDPATLPPGLTLPSNETGIGGSGRLLRSPLGGGTVLRQNFPLIRTQVHAGAATEAAHRSPLVVAVGELGIGISGAGPEATGQARRLDGDVSIFYQDSLTQRDLLTVAVRSKEGVNSANGNTGLFEFDSSQSKYPVTGDGSTRQEMAQSTSRVYARYDRGHSYVMYGDLQGDTNTAGDGLLDYGRSVTGMRFRLDSQHGPNWFETQIARPKTAYMREVSSAVVGPAVRLSRSQILPGSETITLEVRDRRNPERLVSREVLIRNVDYTLDPASGVLFMMRSMGLFDSSLNLLQLISTYEYQTTGVDSTMYRGRASYSVPNAGLNFGFSAMTQNQGGMNFAVGGIEVARTLPNGGRFKFEMPISSGRLPAATDRFGDVVSEHNGKAVRAEFEQPLVSRETVIRGHLATTDDGFFNPYGSITVQGQQSGALSLETRGFESGRLSFTVGKEVNRNTAVDNERKTVSVKLSQTLRENLQAEAGVDRREFNDHRLGQEIDSHLVSAGLRWNPFARLETFLVREQNLGDADPTYPSQTLLGTQFKMSSSSRLFATQRFSSAPIVPIGGAEISGLFSPQSTMETAIGMESRLRQSTSMTTRYRVDSGPAGTDSFAVVGLLTRVPVRSGASIDWSLDNAVHLAGAGRGYVGGSLGFSQSKDDKLMSSFRYELRRRDSSEHIFMAGLAGRLTAATSALARYRINSSGPATIGGTQGQLAFAVRPRQSDRVALLFSYDYGAISTGGINAALMYNRRMNRLSADSLVEVRHGLEFYTRVAAVRTPTPSGGNHQATYLQGRLQQALRKRFDIAGEARWIRESANLSGTLVTGVEWGTWLSRDFRVGLGYSPKGFNNPGALLNSTAVRGGTYLIISSRLSSIFDLMGGSEKTKPGSGH